MSRRVSKLAVALLALSLSLNTPVYAAATRDGGWTPRSAYDRIASTIKKLIRPVLGVISFEDHIDEPVPPRP